MGRGDPRDAPRQRGKDPVKGTKRSDALENRTVSLVIGNVIRRIHGCFRDLSELVARPSCLEGRPF
jgi:hypothetical protein